MAKAPQPTATFRLTVRAPLAGVVYSLQGKDGAVVDARMSTGKAMVFEVSVRIGEGPGGPRVLGEFVRTEGKTRRFFYIATGQQAGQANTDWSRRAKIDFPEITRDLAARAASGKLILEAGMDGVAGDGGPACATIELSRGWTVAKR